MLKIYDNRLFFSYINFVLIIFIPDDHSKALNYLVFWKPVMTGIEGGIA